MQHEDPPGFKSPLNKSKMEDNQGKNSIFDVSAKPSESNVQLLAAQGSNSNIADAVEETVNEEIYDKS